MIINDYVLTEMNRERRAQVAESIAARRAGTDRRRPRGLFRRRDRVVATLQQVPAGYRAGAVAR